MRKLKHLPVNEWPKCDREAFRAAYEPGDVFDETAGPGAHLSEGTRKMIEISHRRWLGFLKANYPDALSMRPAERINPERVRSFIEHLTAENKPITVTIAAHLLYTAARLIAPITDWTWLRSIGSRLGYRACPEDRFDRLAPPLQTLNFGIELMDAALKPANSLNKRREIQYRDGLLLALESLRVIRRRSLAALTVSGHFEFDDAGVNILLHPVNTKAKRAESYRVPEQLLPYIMYYLQKIRPVLLGRREHDAFWVSYRGCPLTAGRLYDIARARLTAKFGKTMGLHDFRRSASTFLAMEFPEKIGLISGVLQLQHASPDVNERHYNLARSAKAGQRFAAHLAKERERLRPISRKNEE